MRIDLGWAEIVVNDDKSFDILSDVNRPLTAAQYARAGKVSGEIKGSALRVSQK